MASPRRNRQTPRAQESPPAKTVEGRENQLIGLATNLAEKQMREGSASSQVITHFLKLATVREGLEREKIRRETELLRAKAEAAASSGRMEELYDRAIQAMRTYSGRPEEVILD